MFRTRFHSEAGNYCQYPFDKYKFVSAASALPTTSEQAQSTVGLKKRDDLIYEVQMELGSSKSTT